MEQTYGDKFFLLRMLEEHLSGAGMSSTLSKALALLTACLLLGLLAWVLDRIGTRIVLAVIRKAVRKTETLWDDYLLQRKFFPRLIEFVTAALLMASVHLIFRGYDTALIAGIEVVLRIYMTVVGALIVASALNAVNDIYDARPQARRKSIRGYVQTAKIVVYVICGILIVAVLIRRDPTDLLLGLGASAAFVSLVFKDTILGFVASIQLSAQDMIRPGDWIEMPSKGADGTVSEINVNSVKVRNWDNTMTMIPIYSLVSEAFTNWRNMEEGAGRRFRRPLPVDVTSIVALSPERVAEIAADPLVAPLAARMIELDGQTNTSPFSTNLGLFRCYAEAYLQQHPHIARGMTILVRYLPVVENGLPLELYAFTSEKSFPVYERVVADMLDHLIAAMPRFGLRLFQRPAASAAVSSPVRPES